MSKITADIIQSRQTGDSVKVKDLLAYPIQSREYVKRLAAEAGFNLVDGSFEEGAGISGWPDVVWCQTDGKYYQWHLDEAKTVSAGSTPATSGTVVAGTNPASGGFVDVSGSLLRDYVLNTTAATFKNEHGYSAVENMIAGRVKGIAGAVAHRVGNVYSTGGTIWELRSVSAQVVLSDFTPLCAINVRDFGAKGDAETDDTTAIQSAIDVGPIIYIPEGNYAITAPLLFDTQIIQGAGVSKTTITPKSDAAAFKYNGRWNDGGEISGIFIHFSSSVPDTANNTIGIDYGEEGAQYFPVRYKVSNVTVWGATYCIRDNSGAWGGKYKQVHSRDCRIGFSKFAGTCTVFEQCYASENVNPYVLRDTHTVSLRNCAADRWNTNDGAAIEIENCPSFEIKGFQSEGGHVGDNEIAFWVHGVSNGKIEGLNLLFTTASIASGNVGTILRVTSLNSNVTLTGCTIKDNGEFTGDGELRFISAENGSHIREDSGYYEGMSNSITGTAKTFYTPSGDRSSITKDDTTTQAYGDSGNIKINGFRTAIGYLAITPGGVTLQAGKSVSYDVPFTGGFSSDIYLATPTFEAQGEIITARYVSSTAVRVTIFNANSVALIIGGGVGGAGIYVQAMRRYNYQLPVA